MSNNIPKDNEPLQPYIATLPEHYSIRAPLLPEDNRPFRIYTATSVGKAIRHYRHNAGITQAQLAEQVGVSVTYLSRLENGQDTEHFRRVVRILKELGVRMTLQRADW